MPAIGEPIAPKEVVVDQHRLRALCDAWRETESDIRIVLSGFSMYPTLLPGERLLLRCGAQDYRTGDLVAYRRDGCLIVHRLLEIREDLAANNRSFLLKGDSDPQPDLPVPDEAVVGRVISVEPHPFQRRLLFAVRFRLGRFWRLVCYPMRKKGEVVE